jgi:hypothetical protein
MTPRPGRPPVIHLALLCAFLFGCGGKVATPGEPRDPLPPAHDTPGAPVVATPVLEEDGGPSPSVTPGTPVVLPPVEGDAGSSVPPVLTGVTLNAGGTIAFTPTQVDVARYPAVCGIMNPPFMDGDLYSMDIIGSMAQAPYDELSISFPSPVMVGTPMTPAVQPFSTMGTELGGGPWYAAQTAQGSDINFSYIQGSDPTEIDTGAFDSVTITILAMPMKDGNPLTIHLRIHFVDGLVLDETYSGPLVSGWSGCGAG